MRGKRVGQSAVVERREDAADHGDAEGASEQASGVVDGGADGEQADTRRERPVALQELEVLGDQEAEACYPEECDGDGTARRGEAKVAEEADVEHRLFGVALAEDEGGEERRCDRE